LRRESPQDLNEVDEMTSSGEAVRRPVDRTPPRLSIGEVCRLTGIRPGTLRNWEERYGLLKPERTAGGTRLYSRQDVERIREIQALRRSNGNSLLAVARSLQSAGQRSGRRKSDRVIADVGAMVDMATGAAGAAEFERQLHVLATIFTREHDLDSVLTAAVGAATAIFDCDGGTLAINDDRGNAEIRATAGEAFTACRGFRYPVQDGPVAQSRTAGRPFVLNDIPRSVLADHPLTKRFGYQAGLFIPIDFEDRHLGTLSLIQTRAGRSFGPSALPRAEILAADIAAAIVNARTFEELQQSRADALALLDLSKNIGWLGDGDDFMTVIALHALALLGADFSAVGSPDSTQGVIRWRGASGTRAPLDDMPFRLTGDVIFEPLEGGKLVFFDDLATEIGQHPDRLSQLHREGAASALFVPLGPHGARSGILLIGYRTPHLLTERERQLAQSLAQLAGASLEKSQLIAEATAAERQAKALYESGKALTSGLALEPMLEELCRQAAASFEATAAMVLLIDGDTVVPSSAYGFDADQWERIRGLRLSVSGPTLTVYAMRTRETQVVGDARNDTRPDQRLLELMRWNSMIMAPLVTKGAVLGLLALGHADVNHFAPQDRETASSLASQAAAAIDHARTFIELQRRQRVAELEVQIATTASASLDVDAVVNAICTQTATALGVDRVALWLTDGSSPFTRVAEAGIGAPEAAPGAFPITPDMSAGFPLGRGVTLRQLRAVSGSNHADLLTSFGLADMVLVPFGAAGNFAGILTISELHQPDRFGPDDVAMVEAISRQAQLAITNALAYREQQGAIQRLGEIDRMKSSFLATMRHELRTPLNAVLGFSDLLQNPGIGELNLKQARYVANIRHGGELLLRLVDDIIEYSRLQSIDQLEPEAIGVRLLLDEVAASDRRTAEGKSVALEVVADPGLPSIIGDRVTLGRALRHLVDNAIKFTPAGGRVTIRATRRGGVVDVSVADSGPGIAADDQARIFHPFVQVDSSASREHEGTGLGLAIVARIAEVHQGSVTLQSAPGQGSTFTLHLPIQMKGAIAA